jgi:hypothetical protein
MSVDMVVETPGGFYFSFREFEEWTNLADSYFLTNSKRQLLHTNDLNQKSFDYLKYQPKVLWRHMKIQ